jgi:hypothetical protein
LNLSRAATAQRSTSLPTAANLALLSKSTIRLSINVSVGQMFSRKAYLLATVPRVCLCPWSIAYGKADVKAAISPVRNASLGNSQTLLVPQLAPNAKLEVLLT